MFQRATIATLALILVLAAAMSQPGLALLCALLLITAGMSRLWSRWSLRRVVYERRLSQQRAFPDDEIELTIKVTNRKLLPLAGLRILDRLPTALSLVNATTAFSGARQAQLLQRRTSLRWYESVSWRYTLRCTARGAYRLGPVQLLSGDPFGLYGSDATHEVYTSLLIYPRLLSLPELGLPARN
ncbi:MAG: DUF11 domain-containing protein, partial [Oscillochloris sp.]|nr:DUF11 domain-containing protein [Oscillochloris sp.]